MKTISTLFIFLLLLSVSAFATVRTVSNDPNNPAQYSSLQTAITAANAGDTIYVQATYVTLNSNGQIQNAGTNYGAININKKLTLIGSGYNPSQDIAYISTLGTVTFDTTVAQVGTTATGASGSVISGFYIDGSIGVSGNYTNTARANNLTIERCWVNSEIYVMDNCNNTVVQQCVFYNSYFSNNTNLIIRNNIINGQVNLLYGGSNPVNCIITNNDFIGSVTAINTSAYTAFGGGPTNLIITNNIFYSVDPTGAANSTYNNNITFANANPALPPGTNVGSGNFANTNPTFVNYPLGSANYNPTYNFALASGSPGKNAGTDGTDIGVYGGIGFVPSGAPNVPYIEHFVISNSSISVGQNLNVTIEAQAQK